MEEARASVEVEILEPAARMRIVSRLTIAYLLDVVSIIRGERDPVDTLLVSAIIQANVADLIRTQSQTAEVGDDEIPPDELRRPVSVSAIAASLGLPFETVRRRVNGMVREGYCQVVEGGVIVPTAVLANPQYFVEAFRGYERLRAFYYQLRDCGVLGELPPPEVELSANNFPVRAATRLVGAYVLRIVETMGLYGDITDGLILLEIFRSNVEHVPADRAEMVTDAERRPVPVSTLAARLGLPAETVRRRVSVLVERRGCARVRGGLIVPTRVLTDPRLVAPMAGNGANLRRLFATLSRMGVLKVWDSLPPP